MTKTTLKFLVVALLGFVGLTGCVTRTYLDSTPPITTTSELSVDHAYFYGTFGEGPNRAGTQVIRFQETESGDWINLPLAEFEDPILVEVPAGTYQNTFGVYTFDVFYWYRRGEYPGPASQLSDPFTVETGTVYYVGTFGPEFFLDFEGAQAAFIEQFGEPAGIEFRMAYGQEVEDL